MYVELIVHALNRLGLATEREISDFINLSNTIDRDLIKLLLEENDFDYYECPEFFAQKRYTLSFKDDTPYPLPKVNHWPADRSDLINYGENAIETNSSVDISMNDDEYKFLPDYDRYRVVFCISSKINLDGVIDFRYPPVITIRFPTILYETTKRSGKSEWLRACELFSRSEMTCLKIRGTDL